MKINRFNLHNLRNDEFFQFFTRVRDLVSLATPAALRIEAIGVAIALNINVAKSSDNLSDVFLSNVEALANTDIYVDYLCAEVTDKECETVDEDLTLYGKKIQ
jgi:hypothetical protein